MTRTLLVAALFLLGTPACKPKGKVASLPKSTPPATVPPPAAAAAPSATGTGAPPAPAAAPASSPFFSGTTESHRRSTITPKLSSSITRVHVRDGDMVKEGQPLVTLDTQDFLLRTQQAEAQLLGARVQVDATRLEWDRIKALLADQAVPASQFDMVDAKLKGAQAALQGAQTAVAMGKKALRDATVRAPFSGLIVKRFVNEGEYASVMPATPLVSIEEVDPIDLRIQIPAAEMTKVKTGDAVRVRFPALDKEMSLRLTRVVAASDPRTRTFTAIVEIPNPDHSLRSGLYAEINLDPSAPAADPAPAATKRGRRAPKARIQP